MKKRQIMATSSIAVALFLSSYSSTAAANYVLSRSSLYSQNQNISVVEYGQEYFGVNASDPREELGTDPTFSVSLIQQGFSPSQIQKIFTSASLKNDYDKLPLSD